MDDATVSRQARGDRGRPSRAIAERLATCLLAPDDRPLFLQVARGERSVDHVSPLLHPIVPALRGTMPVLIEPLPHDTLPLPGPLPPGSRMPLCRNPLFVGRTQDLRALAQALTVGGAAVIGPIEIAAATGLGGIGKTQLACEFVHRYGQYFPGGVFWLSFADPATIPAEVAACGGDRGMHLHPAFDQLPLAKQVQLVQAAWERPLSRLLVFDNCEDERLLDEWRPRHGGCRILITSRRQHWDMALGVQVVRLDVLPRRESLRLLHQFRPDLSEQDADLQAIAAMLGDLPLALHLAGSFLAKYRHALTPAQYQAHLQSTTILDDRSLREAGISPTQHVQHVARTFAQSYERLDPADPTDALALTLLAHVACFAPGEPLPRWLLRETLTLPEDDGERALRSEDALTRLIDLGLLDTDAAGNSRLHRLVGAFARAVVGNEPAQAIVEAAMLRVADTLNQTRNPRPVLAVQPHLRFITEMAQPRADARTAALCNALGYHLWLLGVYAEAQHYLKQALAIRERVLGCDHPVTAISLHNLGMVFHAQGQYAVAQRYQEQALAIFERVLGTDHPDTARSLIYLGAVLRDQGQYVEAQNHYEQALAIQERVLGIDHPDTARSLCGLGSLLRVQGETARARDYLEQALAIFERVLGTDHPDIAMSLYNLGMVFHAQGQYGEARCALEQALAIYEQAVGSVHPSTQRVRASLAALVEHHRAR